LEAVIVVSNALTKFIRSLDDLERHFGIQPANDRQFFTEWQTNLPELPEGDDRHLEQIRTRFRYQRKMGQVAEWMVNAWVVTPLLGLVGFYDPPFQMTSERTITIETIVLVDPTVEDSKTKTVRGRVDFLVLQNQFWQAVIESKETSFDIEVGIPQILAYMMAAPKPQTPLFGMVTNGSRFVFIKLDRQGAKYEFSNTFSTLSDTGQLQDVLQILKRIGAIIHPQ
jgi:Type I restriction enzyme R protein N terminus (HSDR_N)